MSKVMSKRITLKKTERILSFFLTKSDFFVDEDLYKDYKGVERVNRPQIRIKEDLNMT